MTQLKKSLGLNAGYIAELYEDYLKDPESVSLELREFFQANPLEEAGAEEKRPPARVSAPALVIRLRSLVQAIREKGHMAAELDPLGLRQPGRSIVSTYAHGLSESDLRSLPADLIDSPLAQEAQSAYEVVERLKGVYCGTAGYEYDHLRSEEERQWLQEAIESGKYRARLGQESKRNLLERLTQVEVFEHFLHRSFPGQKWFSLEGNDMLVPLLDEIIWEAARSDLKVVTMGMAHRGRLNVLAHVLDKSYTNILAEFAEGHHVDGGPLESSEPGWMRDVKYHMGARRKVPSGVSGELTLVMMPNPSHLELVMPVVQGAARAYQERDGYAGETRPDESAAMPVILHGDAAFAGQGIVAESFNLSRIEGYRIGGGIHVVVNNQVGFTTVPQEYASTMYATDVARGFEIPIVHVNADDPVACVSAARLAFAYRQRFHKDFVIDLIGYRRYGHNEGDEPSFTQPVMYSVIAEHPTVRELWARQVVAEGVVSEAEAEEMVQDVTTRLRRAFDDVPRSPQRNFPQWLLEPSDGLIKGQDARTAVPSETLVKLNQALRRLPEGFRLHPRLERPFQRRLEALEGDGRIDWAHAEELAFASLVAEGVAVRLTGQDTERGTFSQRHSVLVDVETGRRLVPLRSLEDARAPFVVFNSPLSEAGVLAYEYGYSVHAPETLVLWEAQFGDFVNNAQSIVDEFIASARAKWGQSSGIVLLLPHGYEGQGPNHSSAYLERFLQLCANGNMQVAYPTTAAQYFHLLRRQAALMKAEPRPLVAMTAKSLLRHPIASSSLHDLAYGEFQPVIDDRRMQESPESVRRIIFCTGKVFVDLVTSEDYARTSDVAVVRIEELYPFPKSRLESVLARYNQAEEFVWLQEEPRNRGAWGHVAPLLRRLLKPGASLAYAGRPALPSPAEGSLALHRSQQEQIIRSALTGMGSMPAALQEASDGR